MNRIDTLVLAAFVLAIAAVAPAAGAAEDSEYCDCWYEGFEDGLEYRWDNRHIAEDYEQCVQLGQLAAYEKGFEAVEKGAERKCSR